MVEKDDLELLIDVNWSEEALEIQPIRRTKRVVYLNTRNKCLLI